MMFRLARIRHSYRSMICTQYNSFQHSMEPSPPYVPVLLAFQIVLWHPRLSEEPGPLAHLGPPDVLPKEQRQHQLAVRSSIAPERVVRPQCRALRRSKSWRRQAQSVASALPLSRSTRFLLSSLLRDAGCDGAAGNLCASERDPSMALMVNDTIHLSYVLDVSAGDAELGQGSWTFNPTMYYRIPGGTDAESP